MTPPAVAEPRAARARRWAGVLAGTSAAQAVVQGLTLLAGLYVVRTLAPEQYALYTIATTALGAMTVVSDSGVSSGVLATGGRVWRDPAALGGVLAAGLQLRRRLALAVACVALPAVVALLLRQGAGAVAATLLALAILPVFAATLTTTVLESVPRLHQQLVAVQRVQLGAAALRAAGVVAAASLAPAAAVVLLAAAPSQWWANLRLRSLARPHAAAAAPDAAAGAELRRVIGRSMPLAIYYALSGQLVVLLVALFGNAGEVAAVGALGRVAMVLTAVGAVFTLVALPRFARLPDSPALVRARYWQAQGALFAVCLLPVLAVAAAPAAVVMLLGPAYSHLEHEAVLAVAGSAVGAASGAALALGAARGLIAPARIVLPACIAVQLALIAVLPVGTAAGVLWLGLLSSAAQWGLHAAYFELRRPRALQGEP